MTPQFPTLDALTTELNEMGEHTAEYWDKQVHKVPKSKTLDRTDYLKGRCKDKVVLHIGCTGALDQALCAISKRCYGIDQAPMERKDYTAVDLDSVMFNGGLPDIEGIEVVICGEVLEHLSNPGYFLLALRKYNAPVVFTVPNAFTTSGQEWLIKRGRENVNKDHVCYYSYTTIKELLRRAGWAVTKHYWYGGKPYVSEGLIVEARIT